MHRARPLVMTALVSLFLAEGQRAFFPSLFGLGSDALVPSFRPVPALAATSLLLALLAPLLPLARWLDRRGAVAVAACGMAIFRLPMTHPALGTRAIGGALILACGAMFLTWAVGYLDRRALAGGVVVGLVADQLLRLAGGSYDLSLQPGWLPVQAVLSLALVAVTLLWVRAATPEAEGQDGLERRAGGLRLRGALAVGALLFIDLHVLGLPPVIARWTGVDYPFAAVAVGIAGALAVAAALLLRRPTRGRTTTLLLVALVAASALMGYWVDGAAVAIAMAAGHAGALLLIARSLDPASGRRGGVMVTAGFAVFALATAVYALSFHPPSILPALGASAPWIFAAGGLLLAGCFVLLPRPAEAATPVPPLWAGGLAVGVALAAVILSAGPGGGGPVEMEEEGGNGARVAIWNVHYGFDEGWRFDPGAIAGTLGRMDADVVLLQEVPVGAPTAYGIDLPLWLGRRAGLREYFSPTAHGLLGDAFLTRLEDVRVEAHPLPASEGDRRQLLRLEAQWGDQRVSFNGLHLGVDDAARTLQMRAALAALSPGPAVLMGDLNAEGDSPVAALMAEAGFQDAFRDAGSPIWLRGLRAGAAAVLSDPSSDHRPVVATLHILQGRIRSTEGNDI